MTAQKLTQLRPILPSLLRGHDFEVFHNGAWHLYPAAKVGFLNLKGKTKVSLELPTFDHDVIVDYIWLRKDGHRVEVPILKQVTPWAPLLIRKGQTLLEPVEAEY
jgi:hypothetical protein